MTKGIPEPAAFRFGRQYETNDSGCWIWAGRINNRGYGVFHVGSEHIYAHRWAYEYVVGAIPPGPELDHLCFNPACVNPKHLEPVTHEENLLRREAQNADSCINGHPFTEANTYRPPSRPTRRMCRTCTRLRSRAAARKKTATNAA